MLFRKESWSGLADGSITTAFRWWRRPTVRPGGTLRSVGGVLAIDVVEVVELDDITEADAVAAGFVSLAALLDDLVGSRGSSADDRHLYRIRWHDGGVDPRLALRNDDALHDADLAELVARLDRLDRHADEPWTRSVLEHLVKHEAQPARLIAEALGTEQVLLKRRVRRLKELGLTESLGTGYRVSPRGVALLSRQRA